MKINNFRIYNYQLKNVAQNLKKINKTNKYTMTTCYLQNFSKNIKIKIIKKHDIKFSNVIISNFMKYYETIMFLTKTKYIFQ